MKKIAAALTIAIMILGGSSGWLFNSNISYASSYTDNTGELLSAMGIISGDSSGNMNLNSVLTRSAFSKMIVMASTYKDQVATNTLSSIFIDVSYSHWAAPYVKVAVSNGILSGFSDGSFKPDNGITYEQAINSSLKLLGYIGSDFKGGSFPYAQINMAASVGLTSGMNSGVGQTLTRQDGVALITNLLNCKLKDGSKTYGESLGYKLNSSGLIDYASAISANMKGPITVTSSLWYEGLGLDASTVNVYRDGSRSSMGSILTFDVAYYSKPTNTVWAYSKKVSGIYEKALPNQDAPSSIAISGNTYQIGSAAAYSSLSSVGTLKPGNSITILLDKDGNIADALSSDLVSSEATLYITEIGSKIFQNSDNENYSSDYIKGVTTDGSSQTYAITDNSAYEVGDVVTVGVEDGSMNVSIVSGSSSGIYGIVDSDLMTVGSSAISASASILDTYKGAYATVSPQRLDGLTLDSSKVLYYKAENGKITQMVLNNATGDAADYGIVLSSIVNQSGMTSSGKYTYIIDGLSASLNTSNLTYNVSNGPAAFYISSGTLKSMRNITALRGNNITNVTQSSLYYTVKIFKFADDVSVYKKIGNVYAYSNTSEMLIAEKAGKAISYYYDNLPENGGRIRIIIF